MENSCPNCNHLIIENFCSNCGQKKYKRIDKKYVLDEIQYTLLHTNKGLFYSLKKLIKSPGTTAKEYIAGNRVNHYKPILLVFLLSGISAFISYKLLGFGEIINDFNAQKYGNSEFLGDLMSFTSNYTAILMLMMVPVFALTTKLLYRKWGHNYYEHIVMNCYILAAFTLISMIIVYPIMFFLKDSPDSFLTISQIPFLIVPFVLVWFFRGFYGEKPVKSIVLRSLSAFGIFALGYLGMIIVGSILLVIYAMIYDPELIKYMQPPNK
jgi:hypothetical protein